jgi:hypothetical protein
MILSVILAVDASACIVWLLAGQPQALHATVGVPVVVGALGGALLAMGVVVLTVYALTDIWRIH